jgi:hypothetical protein
LTMWSGLRRIRTGHVHGRSNDHAGPGPESLIELMPAAGSVGVSLLGLFGQKVT